MIDNNSMDGWKQWSKHVLAEMARLSDNYESLKMDVQDIKIELAKLKMQATSKAKVSGAIAGAIPAGVVLILLLLQYLLKAG